MTTDSSTIEWKRVRWQLITLTSVHFLATFTNLFKYSQETGLFSPRPSEQYRHLAFWRKMDYLIFFFKCLFMLEIIYLFRFGDRTNKIIFLGAYYNIEMGLQRSTRDENSDQLEVRRNYWSKERQLGALDTLALLWCGFSQFNLSV